VAVERDLAPGEWSVLALLADTPSHGWALAREMSRNGEVGSVWSVGRPLVYRALELLEERRLVEQVGHERGDRGPNRELFRATDEGRQALRRWLADPVDHVREIRSVFLLKLVLIQRAGMERRPLLRAQRAVAVPAVEALRARLGTSAGSERVFVRFRLESTQAVVHFIDGLLQEEEETEDPPLAAAAEG
jgi:DNA-binding PadR family transcriptional regulator